MTVKTEQPLKDGGAPGIRVPR